MKAWKLLKENTLHKGWRHIQKKTFRSSSGKEMDFEIREDGDCVAVLAITPDQDVILARQFRPGPAKVMTELPGGGIESGETPKEAAARELLEETGFAGELEFVCESWENPYSTLHRYNFIARHAVEVAPPKPDEGEEIEVIRMPLDEFRRLMRSGQGCDTESAYLCMDALGLL